MTGMDRSCSRKLPSFLNIIQLAPRWRSSSGIASRSESSSDRGRAVVEFGSGSSAKTPILLGCVEPAAYVPIDISGDFLRQSAAALADAFPKLLVMPLEADFTNPLVAPDAVCRMPKLGFFPGSTIGNMVPRTATNLLRAMHETLGVGAMLLVGIDCLKEEETLIRAYDDLQGVTAAFNLNLLHRINRELGSDIPVGAFRHVARWNAWEARIEMHLEATRNVAFTIDSRRFTWPRARQSTRRTATNTGRKALVCCCALVHGRQSAIGLTRKKSSP